MPIYKGNTEISKVYKGSVALDNIQAGTAELWTNAVAPTVSTSAASSVGGSSMTLNGNLTNTGGASITDHGFYFGTNSNYLSNTKISLGAKGSTGTFSTGRTGLSQQTTYYITAYATNSAGTTVGSTVSQTTPWVGILASISTSSRMTTTKNNDYSNHVHYYQKGYSGTLFSRYNSTGGAFVGTRYYGSHGPTIANAYTNGTNRMVFGVEYQAGSGYVEISIIRAGSRTFNTTSSGIYFGGGTHTNSLSSTTLTSRTTVDSSALIAYTGVQFRYS